MGASATTGEGLATSDRERILQAMASCCAETGYAETTVEAVVERAAVSSESFGRHFSGKEDCALAALNLVVSETVAAVATASGEGMAPARRRTFEGGAILELLGRRAEFARLGFIDARQGGTVAMHRAYESAVELLALMLERTGNRGGRTERAARAALGGAEALMRRELVGGRDERLSRLLPDLVYAALVPIVGQGEALRQSKLAASLVAEEE